MERLACGAEAFEVPRCDRVQTRDHRRPPNRETYLASPEGAWSAAALMSREPVTDGISGRCASARNNESYEWGDRREAPERRHEAATLHWACKRRRDSCRSIAR